MHSSGSRSPDAAMLFTTTYHDVAHNTDGTSAYSIPSRITPTATGRGSNADKIRPYTGKRFSLSVNAPNATPNTQNASPSA